MTDNLISASDVYKRYRKGKTEVAVLRGASFSVEVGNMVAIIGASGAGKSTLLHVLGTLEKPDQGKVFYRDDDLSVYTASALADFRNHELGFVFQFHHLLNEFSALENVMMPALIRRTSKSEARNRAEKVLKEVGLSHRLYHRPGELSGGEQQRVALARALVMDPPLLLADEVTGNLDEKTGEEIHELLFQMNQSRNITIVVVTHNLSLAERMRSQYLLENGVLKELA